ncbi:MAG TPA: hypothetical protein VFS21_20510 [Roseiflexaceae bacterium]|nr:hypothetical protein [Roseiflexaceae bacterium]
MPHTNQSVVGNGASEHTEQTVVNIGAPKDTTPKGVHEVTTAAFFGLLNTIGWLIGLHDAALYDWIVGLSNTAHGIDMRETSIALGGLLAGVLSAIALPAPFRRGNGWRWWILASVPVWLLCASRYGTTSWYSMWYQGDYDNAVFGPLILALLAQGVGQTLVLRRAGWLALLWIVEPLIALVLALFLTCLVALAVLILTAPALSGDTAHALGRPAMLLGITGIYGMCLGFTMLRLSLDASAIEPTEL